MTLEQHNAETRIGLLDQFHSTLRRLKGSVPPDHSPLQTEDWVLPSFKRSCSVVSGCFLLPIRLRIRLGGSPANALA